MNQRRFTFSGDDNFAVSGQAMLHSESVKLPTERKFFASKVRQKFQICCVLGSSFFALCVEFGCQR